MTAPGASTRPRGALVTGAGRGIGRAIAHALARQERDVIVADVDLEAAEECAQELRDGGWSARAVELDVTDAEMIAAVIRGVDADSPLAAVVNNAGVAFRRPTVEVSAAEYDGLMAVNVRGVFFVLQAALRAMVPRGEGSVVNISSTSAFTASTGPMAVYDASKAAVRMLTQAVAREVAPSGVRVNAVAPGTVETALTLGLASTGELAELARSRVPLGRLGRVDEIAAAVAFLASDAASYVTGHVLVADGGWLA